MMILCIKFDLSFSTIQLPKDDSFIKTTKPISVLPNAIAEACALVWKLETLR